MSERDDGGPAYPLGSQRNANGELDRWWEAGMSLRDWLAGQAIAGMLANPNFEWELSADHTPEENLTRRAFAVADSAIAQRSKP